MVRGSPCANGLNGRSISKFRTLLGARLASDRGGAVPAVFLLRCCGGAKRGARLRRRAAGQPPTFALLTTPSKYLMCPTQSQPSSRLLACEGAGRLTFGKTQFRGGQAAAQICRKCSRAQAQLGVDVAVWEGSVLAPQPKESSGKRAKPPPQQSAVQPAPVNRICVGERGGQGGPGTQAPSRPAAAANPHREPHAVVSHVKGALPDVGLAGGSGAVGGGWCGR